MGRGIERLEELLREFRDFVVATELQTTTSDINSILREAVEESFPRRGSVALRLNLADGLPTVQTDSRKLKRALSELIENAISFQPAGGEVSIATRLAMPDELAAAKLTQGQMFVHVEIADRGPGVPDALKQRIFRPFFTSRTKGMGLGLSIVKGIVEAHQGAIVESGRAGEGARFVIYLPAES